MSPRSKAPAAPISLFLDRVEGDLAVLVLDDKEIKLPRGLLPAGAKEGEYLLLTLACDPETTKKMQERVRRKREDLSRDDDGGDIDL